MCKYAFPSIHLDVAISMQVPAPVVVVNDDTLTHPAKKRKMITTPFSSGMALWEAAYVLADFLSRHVNLAQVAEVKTLIEGTGSQWNNWQGKSGIELGAGLGLPSIVASNLGANMIATDGDDAVLSLLGINTKRNAP
eukprot:gnl/MRDRNA2_/MRDRNA2_73862_c0_seq2.p2 gnl/MRDRNA2_/MRDRNA2_73862_c0~~gnl/MRDRNA2_/MRDRNA2_73862_c0_seq2.p2  ORF type:complete len:137 (+),score=22.69 gnl/MRDRNA2_/MRDRNA2_73862_c0_seq2:179-589(+)